MPTSLAPTCDSFLHLGTLLLPQPTSLLTRVLTQLMSDPRSKSSQVASASPTSNDRAEENLASENAPIDDLGGGQLKNAEGEEVTERLLESLNNLRATANQRFAVLLLIQWPLMTIGAAVWSADAWAGAASGIGNYVWVVGIVGGLLTLPVARAAWKYPKRWWSRHLVGGAQLLLSGLLIFSAAGDIEMHFHIFVSLAFLYLYYDWGVLVTAGVITAIDHFARGIFWPMSMFGVTYSAPGLALIHSGWVALEVGFLTLGCLQLLRSKREQAQQTVKNEARLTEAFEEAEARADEKGKEAKRKAEASQKKNEFLSAEIADLTDRIDRLEDGDLTVSFVEGGTAVSSKHVNEAARMTGQLRAKLHRAIQSVREALKEVVVATHQTASASNQISETSERMATSAEEQSAQAEEVAVAIEELNQTIGENARRVGEVAEAAETGTKEARHGGEVVAETANKMEDVASIVEKTADRISRLEASSEEISQVVDRISDIADETNLLALNASVEAARAGDDAKGRSGQGFAVVAEEVRELAEQADKATSEIADIIEKVQSETQDAVEVARKSSQEAEEGVRSAREAKEALDAIISSIDTVEQQAEEIAAASEEQSTTSEEIAQSIQSISEASQQSTSGVTEVVKATEDLKEVTGRLQEGVGAFVIGGNEIEAESDEHASEDQASSSVSGSGERGRVRGDHSGSTSSKGNVVRSEGH